jgi:glutathione S-transferase
MDVTLYSVAPSHPGRAAHLMLDHKGIEHRVVNLPPGSQPIALRALGFRGARVPALKLDGRRVQGSRRISRELDQVRPEPALFPADPALRAAVEEAERWGDNSYQPIPRRMIRWALARDGNLRKDFAAQARMPAGELAAPLMQPVAAVFARASEADDDRIRSDLAGLPGQLDRIDELIADGTLNGEVLNAADFQIATTTRVLLNFPQLKPLIEGRRAAEHAMRVSPRFGREVPIRLPDDWVPRAPSPAA